METETALVDTPEAVSEIRWGVKIISSYSPFSSFENFVSKES